MEVARGRGFGRQRGGAPQDRPVHGRGNRGRRAGQEAHLPARDPCHGPRWPLGARWITAPLKQYPT
eukprot:9203276-Lingulodinium_polyedra.AAC.1